MEQLIWGGFLDFKTRAGAIRPGVGGGGGINQELSYPHS